MIVEFQAVVRLASCLDRIQPDETPNPVISMHDEVANREARRLREGVGGLRLAHFANETVAKNVLFADNGQARRLETCLERQDGNGDRIARRRDRLWERLNTHCPV